jgi:hypothetical protein
MGASAVTASASGSEHCSAAQMAACKAHGASAAAMAACKAYGADAAAMEAACKAHGASAAAMEACKAHGVSASAASMEACKAHGVSASAASMEACKAHGVSSTAAGMGCKGAGVAATTGAACEGSMGKATYHSQHMDCDACGDMARCEQEIAAAGGRVQMVPLKNGVMLVYTAESPAGIRAVKAAVSNRNEHMAVFASAGDKAHLCPECKAMRGAAASGKLTREVVSIEGGCLTLMTSSDPAIVAQLHSMAGASTSRTKS